MKIVGLGIGRTATTSLHEACEILGYRCFKDGWKIPVDEICDLNHPTYEEYDCFTDTPYYYLYDKIDKKYPNSKFILTHRPIDGWLDSFEKLYNFHLVEKKWGESTHIHHIRFFGQKEFNREIWTEKYNEHLYNVKTYFDGRENDLLQIDIINNDSNTNWEKICNFLDKDIPSEKFPFRDHLKSKENLKKLQEYEIIKKNSTGI